MIKQTQCFKASSFFYCILWITKETQWKLTTCIISSVMHSKSFFIVKTRACKSQEIVLQVFVPGGRAKGTNCEMPSRSMLEQGTKKPEEKLPPCISFSHRGTQAWLHFISKLFFKKILKNFEKTLKILFLFLEILSFLSHCMSALSFRSAAKRVVASHSILSSPDFGHSRTVTTSLSCLNSSQTALRGSWLSP